MGRVRYWGREGFPHRAGRVLIGAGKVSPIGWVGFSIGAGKIPPIGWLGFSIGASELLPNHPPTHICEMRQNGGGRNG